MTEPIKLTMYQEGIDKYDIIRYSMYSWALVVVTEKDGDYDVITAVPIRNYKHAIIRLFYLWWIIMCFNIKRTWQQFVKYIKSGLTKFR